MLIMNKKSVIVLPFSFAFNFECTEGLNLEQFLQGRAKVNNCIAKWRLGACDIQELPLLAASS